MTLSQPERDGRHICCADRRTRKWNGMEGGWQENRGGPEIDGEVGLGLGLGERTARVVTLAMSIARAHAQRSPGGDCRALRMRHENRSECGTTLEMGLAEEREPDRTGRRTAAASVTCANPPIHEASARCNSIVMRHGQRERDGHRRGRMTVHKARPMEKHD
jgi:hypothetical protein